MRNPYSKVSDPNKFFSSAGEEVHVLYSPRINVDGSIRLEKSGEVNIRDEINSHRDETDIAIIMRRLKQGDTSVLQRNNPMYGDFTNLPKSMAEVLQVHIDAEKAFLSLPVDIRSQFGNDVNRWIASAGSDEWMEIMKFDKPISESDIKENIDNFES